MSVNIFQIIITLLGGLAVFIYGMNLMSDGLQKAAGDRMKNILAVLTKNPVLGVLAGALTTAVLQSSSATTVMVIGFVSAGLMTLPQAVSVVLGANIGTTITAQLIAFKIGDYAWVFVIIGFVMFFFFKKEKIVDIGQVMFGFGLLFVGINTMSAIMKPLAVSPVFTDIMLSVQHIPALGVLIGTIMTVVVQSSSATIAVLQNLASQSGPDGVHSIIGLQGSLPILFGDNIGTTITALLASIGASTNAKRTAVSHTIFNLAGTFVFIWIIPIYAKFITFISPKGIEIEIISRQIANAHMFFNILNMLLWLPFIWVLVKIVTKLMPDRDKEISPSAPMFLDYKIIESPVFALHLATKELSRISNIALNMIIEAKKAFLGEDKQAAEKVLEMEDIVDSLQAETIKYLASIYTAASLTERQALQISDMIHVAADIEHIGDHCTNIAEFAKEKIKNKYEFSDKASAEIYECFDSIRRMTTDTIKCLEDGDTELAQDVLTQEKEINEMEDRLRIQHMKRLTEGKCSPEFTVMYIDIIHNIEKIGDYCTNIAQAVVKDIGFHKYKNIKPEKESKQV
ncbi:MAG TPA: Na/Pi cotransporter family protein [Anaerovoracaceae bacterium]|nr:Na/Pi cotransporter family protein [Anaerovoracaceae bacterium]